MKNKKVGFYLLVAVLFIASSNLHGSDGEKESGPKSPTMLAIMKQKSDKWVGVSKIRTKVKKRSSVERKSTFRELFEKDNNQDDDQSTLKEAQTKAVSKEIFGKFHAEIRKREDDEETLFNLSRSDDFDDSGTISDSSDDPGAEADDEESEEEERVAKSPTKK